MPQFERLSGFLQLLDEFELRKYGAHSGKVVYIDDQLINQSIMNSQFQDLGLAEVLVKFSDGPSAVDYFEETLYNLRSNIDHDQTPIQPVSLVLLDINLPELTGFEIMNMIKKMYVMCNLLQQSSNQPERQIETRVRPRMIIRPMICFLT